MLLSIQKTLLVHYVTRQINHFFPDGQSIPESDVSPLVEEALCRIEVCFKEINLPYFRKNGDLFFNHLHGDHYAMFLYLLSHIAWKKSENSLLATKLFSLNKMLHAIDAFYEIELKEVFLFVHPVGTVLGRAKYGNYFVVYQNCSVGSDENGNYPVFGDYVLMYSKASVIGNVCTGNNVTIGANSLIMNINIAENSLAVGIFPEQRVVTNKTHVRDRKFN